MKFKRPLSVGELMFLFLLVLALIFPEKTPKIETSSTSSIDAEVVQVDSIVNEINFPNN